MELSLDTPILLAFALGALHVLEPVHGRSIFHAMLIGSTRSFWRVIRFGAAVTISHIFTALFIAVIAYLLGNQFGVEQLTFGGQVFGIALSALLGGIMLRSALRAHRKAVALDDCHCVCHTVEHEHHDEHEHHLETHQHDPNPIEAEPHVVVDRTTGSAIWLGITGGIIPCTASIATLLLAISSGQFLSGVTAMISFGLGLGITLTIVGALTVFATRELAFFKSERFALISRFAPPILILLMSILSLALLILLPGE